MNDIIPGTDLMITENRERTMNVVVLYGPNRQEFQVEDGATAQTIMTDRFITNLLGYTPGPNNVVLVNGTRAEWTTSLTANDEVEILKRAGNKADGGTLTLDTSATLLMMSVLLRCGEAACNWSTPDQGH